MLATSPHVSVACIESRRWCSCYQYVAGAQIGQVVMESLHRYHADIALPSSSTAVRIMLATSPHASVTRIE